MKSKSQQAKENKLLRSNGFGVFQSKLQQNSIISRNGKEWLTRDQALEIIASENAAALSR